jgi:hypothetical protein
MTETTVESLVGEELSAVRFVRDYVEFHFDGPVLRALASPQLQVAGTRLVDSEGGWRDALCSLIGHVVRRVDAREDVHIQLEFATGAVLTVPLAGNHPCPEGAHFQPSVTAPVQVWN